MGVTGQDRWTAGGRSWACLLCPRRSEHVLGAVHRCAGGEASMLFHRGLSSSAARCRAECSAVGGGARHKPLAGDRLGPVLGEKAEELRWNQERVDLHPAPDLVEDVGL